ncbi:MAG: SMC-Scp complex subunit ScpB, partial [Gammaproteobacteria bacterium]
TRPEIEDIRGVAVSSQIIKTLQEREWIRVVGHRDVPGKPAMYGTTHQFVDYFNLKSLDELPTLAEIRDLDSINASYNIELDLKMPGLTVADADDGNMNAGLESSESDSITNEQAVEDNARHTDE